MIPVNGIKTKVDIINGLSDEARSSPLTKEQLNNSTIQALVLANLANEVYFSYGRALGESQSAMSSMAGMAMSVKEASSSTMNMSTSGGNGNNAIKNITEYQTAQALARIAKDVFNKSLKSTAPSILKAANAEIENDLDQLKAAIDNKAPFMDVMKIVHIRLHPILVTAYDLQLTSFR
jgi:hypothetical protein